MIIFKEIGKLPLGPVEISTWWFARSRLAFSTIGLRLWAAASDGGASCERDKGSG